MSRDLSSDRSLTPDDFPKYATQPRVVRNTLQKLSIKSKIHWYLDHDTDSHIYNSDLIPRFSCSPGNIVNKLEGIKHVGYRMISVVIILFL
jgi:hypothetical protein